MDGSCLIILVCLGRYYPPAPLDLFIQHRYLLGPPLECGASVPMTQLLFQIVVLLSEALHGRSESLNLSLEGSCPWFVSLNVVGGCHQESEYHATLCLGSGCMAYKSQSFPQTVPTDDAEKSPMSHIVLVCSQQQLHNKKKRPHREHPVWCQPNTLRMSN